MKTLFLDCDGTLTNYAEELPQSAKLACELAHKKGNILVLCTGRSKATITDDCMNLPIDGIIAANGGYIEYKNECILKSPIDNESTYEILKYLVANKRPFFVESDVGTYGHKDYYEWLSNDFDDIEHDIPEITMQFAKRMKLCNDVLNVKDINKFTFVLANRNDLSYFIENYPYLNSHLVFPSDENSRFCEITVSNVDKGFGVREYCRLTNTKKEDCIGFGDWDNDAIMFEECKENVAMGNGSDYIKSKATYITDNVNENGLYNSFKHFDLI